MSETSNLVDRLRPGRAVTGMSAILLPLSAEGAVDWDAFAAHVGRTLDAGLAPAVNMDTGYVQIIDAATRSEALRITNELCAGRRYVAGAFVPDAPGDAYDHDAYRAAMGEIAAANGTPVVFPSWGLHGTDELEWVDVQHRLGEEVGEFVGFELGTMFVPNGRIVSLDAYRRLVEVPTCIGAKHSSLSRRLEWERLALRDEMASAGERSDFMVLTGNDLAIDMIMWGSDYLLGLSTFAPDAFALRDRYWRDGDARFYEVNDVLQELGAFAFRSPVPGYRHDAAMFLRERGWIGSDGVPAGAVLRPESDRAVLADIARRVEALVADGAA